ncbi:hypothetical protein [Chitinophaga sp. LS1]|nr:hypothetical protein [Chitinophaga sp. LS1]WPV63935.1 hypothetical protein QQL36_19230 [Chitinophaga sp. LS1]
MKGKHILISGASIAGPVPGWWLSKYGWQVTIKSFLLRSERHQ